LKKAIEQTIAQTERPATKDFIDSMQLAAVPVHAIKKIFPGLTDYAAIHYLINHENFDFDTALQDRIEQIEKAGAFNPTKTQAEEILQRYGHIKQIMQQSVG
jgi:ferrous iron transport protein B